MISTDVVHPSNVRDLFYKPNLNLQDDRGYTCLHWLVDTGNDRPLRGLLEQGANPTLRDAKSLTALDRACKLGRIHMVQALVEACPSNLNGRRDSDGRTPLHFANESMEATTMVTYLLELGADMEAQSRLGRTILHESILRGCRAEHLSFLVACGANLHARDVHGWTPLHYAAYLGHVEMVEQLLQYGANPTATDNQGRTPLHVTASKVILSQWDKDVTAMFECNDCNQLLGKERQELLEWSRKFGRRTSSEIVRLLLENGATTWATDDNDNLTFFLAAQVGEADVTYDILRVAAMEGLFG